MKKENGLTLIELMVTLAVFAILVTIAVPQLQSFSINNRSVSQINELAGQIALARGEAVKRGIPITICGSTDSATCNTANWESGMIVFLDVDRDGTLDGGETILQLGEPLSGSNTLRASSFDNTTYITYNPDGTLRDTDNDGVNSGRFTLCDSRGASEARAIDLNNLGRPSRVEGVALTCP